MGEELHVRIGVQEYHSVDKADDHCNTSLDHSYEEGSEVLIAQQVKTNLLNEICFFIINLMRNIKHDTHFGNVLYQ